MKFILEGQEIDDVFFKSGVLNKEGKNYAMSLAELTLLVFDYASTTGVNTNDAILRTLEGSDLSITGNMDTMYHEIQFNVERKRLEWVFNLPIEGYESETADEAAERKADERNDYL